MVYAIKIWALNIFRCSDLITKQVRYATLSSKIIMEVNVP